MIAGDVFILGHPDEGGSATSAPDELADLLMHFERYRVLVQYEGDEEFYGTLRTFGSWVEAYSYGVEQAERSSQVQDVMVVGENTSEPSENEAT